MTVRRVAFALVSSVFFAALVANPGTAFASASSALELSSQAYTALKGGDPARSVMLYSQAIELRELGPEALANALLNRALAYQHAQQNEKSIDDYTTALSLDAMSSELRATALYNRGLAHAKLQHMPLAIEDYTSALLINSSFAHAYLARANSLRDSGQYLFAISDYERALKYGHPEGARVYYGEAQTYVLLKRPFDAKRLLEAAVAADSNFAPAVEQLKTMGDVAESDDLTADPVLTGSMAVSLSGTTEVVKPSLPAGVEPPDSLLAEKQPAPEIPVVEVAQKEITDRLPVEVSDSTSEPGVSIASVPKIPAKAESADIETATLTPAPVRKPMKPLVPKAEAVVETAAAEETMLTGWSVQIASATSEEGAWTTWRNMQKRHKILGGKKPIVVKADLGAKGTFYRVRLIGFDQQSGAQSACSKLKAGGVSCYASKAEG